MVGKCVIVLLVKVKEGNKTVLLLFWGTGIFVSGVVFGYEISSVDFFELSDLADIIGSGSVSYIFWYLTKLRSFPAKVKRAIHVLLI